MSWKLESLGPTLSVYVVAMTIAVVLHCSLFTPKALAVNTNRLDHPAHTFEVTNLDSAGTSVPGCDQALDGRLEQDPTPSKLNIEIEVNLPVNLHIQLQRLKDYWNEVYNRNSQGQLRSEEYQQELRKFDEVFAKILDNNPLDSEAIAAYILKLIEITPAMSESDRQGLEQELQNLREQYENLHIQGEDLRVYKIVRDSLVDPTVTWPQQAGTTSELAITVNRYTSVFQPTTGEVIRIDFQQPGGHVKTVKGAQQLSDGSILSWSFDNTLIVWRLEGDRYVKSKRLGVAKNHKYPNLGHVRSVVGAQQLSDGSILSWSLDNTLIIWRLVGGRYVKSQRLGEANYSNPDFGHVNWVNGAQQLSDGSILSWSNDHTLIIWRLEGGRYVMSQRLGEANNSDPDLGHVSRVNGAQQLSDGSILSWSNDHMLIIWRLEGGRYLMSQRLGEANNSDPGLGHVSTVMGAQQLSDGSILSWSVDKTLIIWRLERGRYVMSHRLGEANNSDSKLGHVNWVRGARQLSDDSILSMDLSHRILQWQLQFPEHIQNKLDRLAVEIQAIDNRLKEAAP